MTSTSDPQSLAEVPPRSVPLKVRMVSVMLSVINNLYFKKGSKVNRELMKRLEQSVPATPNPVDGIFSKDVIYDQETKQYLRIYTPAQEQQESSAGSKQKLPLLIYFHGGGFASGDVSTKIFDSIARGFAKICNAVVVSVNYRLAPEFRYPAAYDDCFQALRWVQSDFQSGAAGELAEIADPARCFVVGDSAGGNIAHFMLVRAAQNDLSPVQIRGGILLLPFFGGAERSPAEIRMSNATFLPLWICDWFWEAFLPVGSDRDHPTCNVFGPQAEDISGLSLPPILITIGSMDILQDWQIRYVEKLKEMGKQVQVKYTGFCHGEYTFPDQLKKVAEDAAEFIKSSTS